MLLSFRGIYFSRICRYRTPLTCGSSLLILRRTQESFYNYKRFFDASTIILEKSPKILHTLSKAESFSDKTTPVILDVEEERQKITHVEEESNELEGLNLERGVTGVFDKEEIVELLKMEKGEDIFVGKIPSECNYADYMVIVNGKSTKHMLALCNLIRRIYKKKVNSSTQIPKLEGKNSNFWMALDLGNIILHVFSKEARKIYDLETLWSVGIEYDNLTRSKGVSSDDVLTDYSKILGSLSPKY